MANHVRCPRCNRKQPMRDGDPKDVVYRCSCGCLFDNDPDEGGTASTDPTRRIERQEEYQARERERKQRGIQSLMQKFNRR